MHEIWIHFGLFSTCIATIRRNQIKDSAVDVLIVGTEQNSIFFIDSQAYCILRREKINATPGKLLALGRFLPFSRMFLEWEWARYFRTAVVVLLCSLYDVYVSEWIQHGNFRIKNSENWFLNNIFGIQLIHQFEIITQTSCESQLIRYHIFSKFDCGIDNEILYEQR